MVHVSFGYRLMEYVSFGYRLLEKVSFGYKLMCIWYQFWIQSHGK